MPFVELTSEDGHRPSAYRAEPAGAPRGGVVVVQEIFGVNAHIRAVTERFAQAGYLAVAPALFDRVERGVELGYDQAGFDRGRALVGQLDYDALLRDLAAAAREAAAWEAGGAGKVGMVGYCFGGAVAWVAAARMDGIACAVSYYGSRIVSFMDEAPRVPLMMHVGRHDASFPLDKVHEIGRRYPDVVIHEHDAGHGFNCDMRGDWNAEAAARALERTLAFLGEHVG
jgi:carboxymethylenebutenolidase